jgi:hypothetical protein
MGPQENKSKNRKTVSLKLYVECPSNEDNYVRKRQRNTLNRKQDKLEVQQSARGRTKTWSLTIRTWIGSAVK